VKEGCNGIKELKGTKIQGIKIKEVKTAREKEKNKNKGRYLP
jgi:hypothetical protein